MKKIILAFLLMPCLPALSIESTEESIKQTANTQNNDVKQQNKLRNIFYAALQRLKKQNQTTIETKNQSDSTQFNYIDFLLTQEIYG